MSKSSQESSPIRTILEEAFTKNIEHDGSYVPVSAIKGKFDQAEAALNAYVEERVIAELKGIKEVGSGKMVWLIDKIDKRIAELEAKHE